MPQSSSSGVYKKFTGTYSMSFGYILRAKGISGIPAERRNPFNLSESSKDFFGNHPCAVRLFKMQDNISIRRIKLAAVYPFCQTVFIKMRETDEGAQGQVSMEIGCGFKAADFIVLNP